MLRKNGSKEYISDYSLVGFIIVVQLLVIAMMIKLEIDSAMDGPTGDGFPRNFDHALGCLCFYAILLFAGIFVGIILRTWKLVGLQLFLPVIGLFTGRILVEIFRP